jgi:hypothetical protein
MDDSKTRAEVRDPFLSELDLPVAEQTDPGASHPMIWPIPPPRVRKLLEAQLEGLEDRHFWRRIFGAVMTAMLFLFLGCGLYVAILAGLSYRMPPISFGIAFSVLFGLLVWLSDFMRLRDPIEDYRAADFPHSIFLEQKARRGIRGFPRIMLFVPGLAARGLRRVMAAAPPADMETLNAALRLLPALHSPLPLSAAEEAGLGGPELVRQAVLLLHAMGLADLERRDEGQLVIEPRGACAELLRGDDSV